MQNVYKERDIDGIDGNDGNDGNDDNVGNDDYDDNGTLGRLIMACTPRHVHLGMYT